MFSTLSKDRNHYFSATFDLLSAFNLVQLKLFWFFEELDMKILMQNINGVAKISYFINKAYYRGLYQFLSLRNLTL